MKIVAQDWLPYCLRFNRAWQTSQGMITERHGELFRLTTEDGLISWGDYAPLPEFGINQAAARAFANETALLDLAAQRAGLTLRESLGGLGMIRSATVNTNLGAISNISEEAVVEAIEQGFSVLKLKVGIEPWAVEIARLIKLCKFLPTGVSFRLDANAAWSFSDAYNFISACKNLPIEGLEEPLNNPSKTSLSDLQKISPFPIALDESTHLIDADFFCQPPVKRMIIKPARQGGVMATIKLGVRAKASGIECVVTSSLESICGVLTCAQIAAALAPDSVHGLATSQWFSGDQGQGCSIEAGNLLLPSVAGLGFSLKN